MQARKTVQGKIVEKKIVCRTDEQIILVQKLVKENCSSVRGLIFTKNKNHKYVSTVKKIEVVPKNISFPICLWPFCYIEKYIHG